MRRKIFQISGTHIRNLLLNNKNTQRYNEKRDIGFIKKGLNYKKN